MNQRHMEFFGPDLGRGPFAPSYLETAAVQIATALAQLRAPIRRSDDDILDHGDFIRQLADRIAPDYAAFVDLGVSPKVGQTIQSTFRVILRTNSLLECWLADDIGGGVTSVTPTSVTFHTGVVLRTITPLKHYIVLTSESGIVDVNVEYNSVHTWRWGVTRHGRVFYSAQLDFD